MRTILVVVLVALMACPVMAYQYTAGVAGNQDQAAVIFGVRPNSDARTEYRVCLNYWDGIRDGTQEAIGVIVGATYDVIDDVNMPFDFPWGLGGGQLKVRGYLGVGAGTVVNTHGTSEWDALAVGIIGASIGDAVNRIGVEAVIPVDPALTSILANMDDISTLRIVAMHKW
jgi:hypothetical protein